MKIKEIMTRDVMSISPDTTAKEALSLLFEKQISGMPVIDKDGRLVGMFTEKDILRQILPSYLEKVGRFVYAENPKSVRKKFQYLENLSVSQVMRKEVITIDEDTGLCEAARLMLTQKLRRIPVLDKEKRVAGIISRADIVRAYAREAGWTID